MVVYCVAYGCNNLHNPHKPITFHTFPFKRPEILELWVNAIRRKDWYPSKTSRICGAHFLPSDFQNIPGSNRKLLKPDAVPSVFNFPKVRLKVTIPQKELIESVKTDNTGSKICEEHFQNTAGSNRKILNLDAIPTVPQKKLTKHTKTGNTEKAIDVNLNSNPDLNLLSASEKVNCETQTMENLPSTSAEVSKTFVNRETQTVKSYNMVIALQRKVKTLQQKIRRRDVKLATMKRVIKGLSKSRYPNENLEDVLKHFEGMPLEVVLMEQ